MPLKYNIENRFAETAGDVTTEIQELNDYFDDVIIKSIPASISNGETVYHVDYNFEQMDQWIWLADHIQKIMQTLECTLDFNEFKHTLKFTFIYLEAGGILPPHTATQIRAMCSLNTPLRGVTKIDLYRDHPVNSHMHGMKIGTHHYTNPVILNVNQFHGVVNATNGPRLMLKTHLPVVSYGQLVQSFTSKETVKLFDFDMPWSADRGSLQRIEGRRYD